MRPLRHVLEALKEALRKELDSLVTQGILAKVTEPTDWVNSLVCVTKGPVRISVGGGDGGEIVFYPKLFADPY